MGHLLSTRFKDTHSFMSKYLGRLISHQRNFEVVLFFLLFFLLLLQYFPMLLYKFNVHQLEHDDCMIFLSLRDVFGLFCYI